MAMKRQGVKVNFVSRLLFAASVLFLPCSALAAPNSISNLPQRGLKKIDALRGLELVFQEDITRAGGHGSFVARGPSYAVLLDSGRAILTQRQKRESAKSDAKDQAKQSVSVRFLGGNEQNVLKGEKKLSSTSSYFIGDDPSKWRTGIAHYARVKREGVYPGIDVAFYGNEGRLEYDFILAAGADPSKIRLNFSGQDSLSIEKEGHLNLQGHIGSMIQHRPIAYQEINGKRVEVEVQYVKFDAATVGLRLGKYDREQALVIDPVLEWGTQVGGDQSDLINAIDVDPSGRTVAVGLTQNYNGETMQGGVDALVVVLNSDATAIVCDAVIGGSGDEAGEDVEFDNAGNIYFTGPSDSVDFPRVNNIPGINVGNFVTKLSSNNCESIVYSTRIGGYLNSVGTFFLWNTGTSLYTSFIAVDDGYAYISGPGWTLSKISRTGNALLWTHVYDDQGPLIDASINYSGVVVGNGNVYFAGSHYPATDPPCMSFCPWTKFVKAVRKDNGAVVYHKVFTSPAETVSAIATNGNGTTYIAGPGTIDCPPVISRSAEDAFAASFLAEINDSGQCVKSTMLPGGMPTDIAVTESGDLVVGLAWGVSYVVNELPGYVVGPGIQHISKDFTTTHFATGTGNVFHLGYDGNGGIYFAADSSNSSTPGVVKENPEGLDGYVGKISNINSVIDPGVCNLIDGCLFSIGTPNSLHGDLVGNFPEQHDFCTAARGDCGGLSLFTEFFKTPILLAGAALPTTTMPLYLLLNAWPPLSFADDGRVVPYTTDKFGVRFLASAGTAPSAGNYNSLVVYSFGSETKTLSWCFDQDGDADTPCVPSDEQIVRTAGIGEGNLKKIVINIPAARWIENSYLNFNIAYSEEGRNNGSYLDYIAGVRNSALFSTVNLDQQTVTTDPRGKVLWQLGKEDLNVAADGIGANAEFTVRAGHMERFTYNVAQNPDYESLEPALPGYLAEGEIPGFGTARQIDLSFSLDKAYPALDLYVTLYGHAGVNASLDGKSLGVPSSSSTGGKTILIVSMTSLRAGAHVLSLSAATSGAVLLDSLALIDSTATDVDYDGLSDSDETKYGTNQMQSDSDRDGVKDGYEVQTGSSPLDSGSALRTLGRRFCVETNGFLNMYNVFETRNNAVSARSLRAELFSAGSQILSTRAYSLPAFAQFDILVHDLSGFRANQIGTICLEQEDGTGSDLSGMMVYYRPSSQRATDFDFVFGVWPHELPANLEQAVAINTYHPGLRIQDRSNFVANWLQVSRPQSAQNDTLEGVIKLYDQGGQEVNSYPVSLAPGMRVDLPGHSIGATQVGTAVWQAKYPSSESLINQRVSLRNSRYYYNNSSAIESFDAAHQLSASAGSGEELIAPVDTRGMTSVVEVLNALNGHETSVRVRIRDAGGREKYNRLLVLAGRSSEHIIVNDIVGMGNGIGSVSVDSQSPESVVVVVMQYGRNADASLAFTYGVPGREVLGKEYESSYNTFLEQGCRIFLVNSTSTRAVANVSVFDQAGAIIPLSASHDSAEVSLGGLATIELDICGFLPDNSYGAVKVESSVQNSILPVMIRDGRASSYRFPVAME